MQDKRDMTIKELAKDCRTIEDVHVMLKDLFRDTIQQLFEAEMDDHLGYAKHSVDGDHSGNSRNGYSKKKLKTKFGNTDIRVPRDRNGEFEPHVVKKHETTVNGLEEQIIALYAKGMSTRDIEDHMKDLYGIDVSPGMVSKVTDKIMPMVAEWQCRPLDRIYPIVFLDAIHFKVRQESQIVNKAAYSVLGISMSGHKDILGICLAQCVYRAEKSRCRRHFDCLQGWTLWLLRSNQRSVPKNPDSIVRHSPDTQLNEICTVQGRKGSFGRFKESLSSPYVRRS